MPNIIMSAEFMAKAKAAKSFEELKSMVAAEGIEVAEDELMAKWEEISSQGSAKKFKLSEEELDNVAGGCSDDGDGDERPTYRGYPKVKKFWAACGNYDGYESANQRKCKNCFHGGVIPSNKVVDDFDMYCAYIG